MWVRNQVSLGHRVEAHSCWSSHLYWGALEGTINHQSHVSLGDPLTQRGRIGQPGEQARTRLKETANWA